MESFRLAFFTHQSEIHRLPVVVRAWKSKFPHSPICLLVFGKTIDEFELKDLDLCLHVISIPEEFDIYFRRYQLIRGHSPFGLKSGPNWSFFEGLRILGETHREPWIYLLEADVVPVGGGVRMEEIIEKAGSHAWVIGSTPPKIIRKHLSRRIRNHLNGVALYRATSPDFRDFLHNVWLSSVLEVAELEKSVAFDLFSAKEFRKDLAPPLRQAWSENISRFVDSKVTLNLSTLRFNQLEAGKLHSLILEWEPIGVHIKF